MAGRAVGRPVWAAIAAALTLVLVVGLSTVAVRTGRGAPAAAAPPAPPRVATTCATTRVTLLVGQVLVLGCAEPGSATVPQQAVVTQLDGVHFVAVRSGRATVTADQGCPGEELCTELLVRTTLAVTVLDAAPVRTRCAAGAVRLLPGQQLRLECPVGTIAQTSAPTVLARWTETSFTATATGISLLTLLARTECQPQAGATCPAIGVSPGSIRVTVGAATS